MIILHNAQIHTLNTKRPHASALAIQPHPEHGGRILAVGDDDFILNEFGSHAEKHDLLGAAILPGLTDAHIHLRYYALNLQKLDLFGKSKQACVELVAERAASLPPGSWVLGHGWDQNHWADGFPSAADLDAAAPQHPVYLTATSLHVGWCNRAALKMAGVTASTPDPHNGTFGRDESGVPDGMLYETAMGVIADAVPSPSEEENIAAITNAQQALWQLGLTGVHDFDRIRSFEALQMLRARGGLGLRVLKNLPVEKLDHIIETGLRSGFGDDLLRIGSIKVFADGALGPHTAAMLQAYEGEPENRGMLMVDNEQFFEYGQKAAAHGLSMTVHAIGDQANHEILTGYAQLRTFEKSKNLPHYRHRLEHAQIVHPDDFARFKELDIIASMQPIHATSDMHMADKYWGERAASSYAWRTMLEHGVRLAFGSDAPVDTPNPFIGLHAAVTRQLADGSPGPEGWYPEQRLTLEEALHGYTSGAAYTAGMEDRQGMLAAGYLADLIVLDEDPFKVEASELRDLKPTATMVGGDWMWGGF